MSFVSRLWNAIRRPIRYVGSDLHGNKFYEAYSPNNSNRPKRTVQYNDPEDMWKYIGGGKRLAVQWSAWLTHTRLNPPSIEELQADTMRQQRMSANVALIEERDRAEAEEMLRIRQSDAAQALEEAAMRNYRLLATPETNQPTIENMPSSNPANNSIPANETTPPPAAVQANQVVMPPRFLTPTTPRKARTTGKFSLPSSLAENDVASPRSHPEKSRTSEPEVRVREDTKTTPPPPMPSRPVSDTETWTSKARRRACSWTEVKL